MTIKKNGKVVKFLIALDAIFTLGAFSYLLVYNSTIKETLQYILMMLFVTLMTLGILNIVVIIPFNIMDTFYYINANMDDEEIEIKMPFNMNDMPAIFNLIKIRMQG